MKKKISLLCTIVLLATSCCVLFGCQSKSSPSDYFSAEEIEKYGSVSYEAKGTVLAYGGGFDQNDDQIDLIIKKGIELTGLEKPRALFMLSGHHDELEEEEEIVLSFRRQGIEPEILLPSKESHDAIVEKIGNADIIYETGGNLNALTTSWGETGVFEEMRKAFVRGAVLMGVSTGAMCWAEVGYDNSAPETEIRIVTDFPFIGREAKYDYFNATGILPFCLCPHFDNIAYKVAFNPVAKKLNRPSLALDNGTAVIYHNGQYEFFTDPTTSNRKAYLFYPDRGIIKVDVTNHPELVNVVSAYWKDTNPTSYKI